MTQMDSVFYLFSRFKELKILIWIVTKLFLFMKGPCTPTFKKEKK